MFQPPLHVFFHVSQFLHLQEQRWRGGWGCKHPVPFSTSLHHIFWWPFHLVCVFSIGRYFSYSSSFLPTLGLPPPAQSPVFLPTTDIPSPPLLGSHQYVPIALSIAPFSPTNKISVKMPMSFSLQFSKALDLPFSLGHALFFSCS